MSTLKVNAIQNSDNETPFQPTSGTAQATTSGTAFDFTGIPSWVSKIIVMFDKVSLSGTDDVLVQLGTVGGFNTAGYTSIGVSTTGGGSGGGNTNTAGFHIRTLAGSRLISGHMTITKVDAQDWIASHTAYADGSSAALGGGEIDALGGDLTQVRLTRTGSNTFDNGQVNIIYE